MIPCAMMILGLVGSGMSLWRLLSSMDDSSVVADLWWIANVVTLPCLGVGLSVVLDGTTSWLQQRAQDFDTVPVCFRTDEVAPQEHAQEQVPRGLFCCRQAGDLSCVIDWRWGTPDASSTR